MAVPRSVELLHNTYDPILQYRHIILCGALILVTCKHGEVADREQGIYKQRVYCRVLVALVACLQWVLNMGCCHLKYYWRYFLSARAPFVSTYTRNAVVTSAFHHQLFIIITFWVQPGSSSVDELKQEAHPR